MKVILKTELEWQLGNGSKCGYHVGCSGWTHFEEVDPFPAYAPDIFLVQDCVDACVKKFPLRGAARAELYILSHESVLRCNGVSFADSIWDKEDTKERIKVFGTENDYEEIPQQAANIVLYAKRIPIHPAMVRYLVAHEYGHAAFNSVRRLMGYQDSQAHRLEKEYGKLRGYEKQVSYVGGKWDQHIQEIIANDFRYLVMGVEKEFWPHPVAPPEEGSLIHEWWLKAAELGK